MSQYHEDHMANKGEYRFDNVFPNLKSNVPATVSTLCIWPECDCELLCDRIRCQVNGTAATSKLETPIPCQPPGLEPGDRTVYSGLEPAPEAKIEKPRYRIYFRKSSLDFHALIRTFDWPRSLGYQHAMDDGGFHRYSLAIPVDHLHVN